MVEVFKNIVTKISYNGQYGGFSQIRSQILKERHGYGKILTVFDLYLLKTRIMHGSHMEDFLKSGHIILTKRRGSSLPGFI